jgi:hypothetical protein
MRGSKRELSKSVAKPAGGCVGMDLGKEVNVTMNGYVEVKLNV